MPLPSLLSTTTASDADSDPCGPSRTVVLSEIDAVAVTSAFRVPVVVVGMVTAVQRQLAAAFRTCHHPPLVRSACEWVPHTGPRHLAVPRSTMVTKAVLRRVAASFGGAGGVRPCLPLSHYGTVAVGRGCVPRGAPTVARKRRETLAVSYDPVLPQHDVTQRCVISGIVQVIGFGDGFGAWPADSVMATFLPRGCTAAAGAASSAIDALWVTCEFVKRSVLELLPSDGGAVTLHVVGSPTLEAWRDIADAADPCLLRPSSSPVAAAATAAPAAPSAIAGGAASSSSSSSSSSSATAAEASALPAHSPTRHVVVLFVGGYGDGYDAAVGTIAASALELEERWRTGRSAGCRYTFVCSPHPHTYSSASDDRRGALERGLFDKHGAGGLVQLVPAGVITPAAAASSGTAATPSRMSS